MTMNKPEHINVAATVAVTEAEGPGRRFALWVQGCPLHCHNCCNPQMLSFTPQDWREVADLAEIILNTNGVEGVTLLGGEPFAQAGALAALATRVRRHDLSVMVFTGYTIEHIRGKNDPGWDALLAQTDLLVDGPYVEKLHTETKRWIGSTNQRIHFLSDRYRSLAKQPGGWDNNPNTVELRLTGDQISINGFPDGKVSQWLNLLRSKS